MHCIGLDLLQHLMIIGIISAVSKFSATLRALFHHIANSYQLRLFVCQQRFDMVRGNHTATDHTHTVFVLHRSILRKQITKIK